MSRPNTSQHRLSVGSNTSSLPVRSPVMRAHSHAHAVAQIHSVPCGSANPSNRINRRKSSTFTPSANPAVLSATVGDASIASKRRGSSSRAALASLNDGPHQPLPSSSLPYHASVPDFAASGSAVMDGPALSTFQGVDKLKPSARRASDGTHLTKRERAAAGDLKCEHCGKAYKHGSCLNKHLWEHTPQWQYTSKLLISKHQQVQLLEAASVLVQMNADGTPVIDSDSPSPAASGSSDQEDEYSSTETTPPPHADIAFRNRKRDSNNSSSSAFSRSYQSALSDGGLHSDGIFAHYRNLSASSNSRPATAATSIAESYKDEDPQDLAAAVGLLSCSYGTPKTGPIGMHADVPPVPPLPAKYLYAQASTSQQHIQDVEMEDDDEVAPHALPQRQFHVYPYQHHEDEEGMFGKMDA